MHKIYREEEREELSVFNLCKKKTAIQAGFDKEKMRFELTRRLPALAHFECAPLNHLGTSPYIGAGEGNRTPAISLGSWSSTIKLHPQVDYTYK
jgi:hypothetical protein